MTCISFDAHFGDEIKRVELSNPAGTGGERWWILIDGYTHGSLVMRNGEYWYEDDWLDAMDVQAALDTIMEYTGQPYQLVRFHSYNKK